MSREKSWQSEATRDETRTNKQTNKQTNSEINRDIHKTTTSYEVISRTE
jgi:hypothetical protein